MARRAQSTSERKVDATLRVVTQTQNSNRRKLRIDDLRTIEPLTDNQAKFFETYRQGKEIIILHGVAGTGKTFIALYKGLEEALDKSNPFDRVVLVRSSVQSREQGHLPGDASEKMAQFELPYTAICTNLFQGVAASYEKLTEQGAIQFVSTSFVRGMTFDDAIVIVDECQNMSFEELDTIVTRVGDRSRIIFCGDYRQTDLKKAGDKSGLIKFLDIIRLVKGQTRLEFGVDDIVRSPLVKNYIMARMEYEDKGN
jgi:phosphate starvation-inducible protein PhoH